MSNFIPYILIFLWIVLLPSTVVAYDSDGITVIYLIDDISPHPDGALLVSTEIHLSSRALGKPLLDSKMRKIYTVHHLPVNNILHSKSNISYIGSWINGTIATKDLEDVWMTTSDYEIKEDGTSIEYEHSCNYSINAISSGNFATPNFPRNYPNDARCTWTIIAPSGTTIHLYMPYIKTESSYDFLYVYDVSEGREDVLGVWSGYSTEQSVQSNGNVLRVSFVSDSATRYSGAEVLYTVSENSVNLEEDNGSIILEQFSFYSKACLSVIYKLFNRGTIEVSVVNSDQDNIIFEEKNRHEANGWNISRFALPGYVNAPINVAVNMTGKGGVLYSIIQCDSIDVDVYSNKDGANFESRLKTTKDLYLLKMPHDMSGNIRGLVTNYLSPWEKSDCTGLPLDCYNGGSPILGTCLCPVGFAGTQCEKACGKNHYGPDCKEICSGFQYGCKRMIFCKRYSDSCSCATGLTGLQCDEECPDQWYGANCNLRCGYCKSGSCNPYTGKCTGGCKDGYQYPYCQEKLLYMKYAPEASIVTNNNVTIIASYNELLGKGSPYLFQVQYKEKLGYWIEMQPDEILLNTSSHNIPKLKCGTKYFVRIIIICKDGNSYQGNVVPFLEVTTHCLTLDERNYEINITDITSSSFSLKWKKKISNIQENNILTADTNREVSDLNHENYNKFCPETEYRVTLHDRWRRFSKIVSPDDSLAVTFTNLLPGNQYKVHMCTLGISGIQFCSSPRTLLTARTDEEAVDDLEASSLQGGSLNVSWSSPNGLSSGIAFKVNYQCMKLLLCDDPCGDSRGTIETSSTFIELHNLVPVALYRIWLPTLSPTGESYSEIFATTMSAKPTTSPRLAPEPLLFVSNSTAILAWDSPNCYGINGNLRGYFYRFAEIDAEAQHKTIKIGNTQEERIALHDLTPQTNYHFDVYAVNSRGWNPDYKISINFTTRGTVPEAVQELLVYKKGRRMLGIRWGPPTRVYGILKSFQFAYRDEVSKTLVNKTLDPTSCSSWPNYYCHTINKLRPDRNYTIFVSARNEEIEEDGEVSVIHGYTRENAPGAPVYLNISDITPNSLVLHWGVPMLINGELRSFLVNVEHIDSLNDDTCCEYFPVYEVPVSEEHPSFSLKVTNLSPTSTYIISVTAKTITLGPSINMTHKTPPVPPSNLSPPQLLNIGDDNASYYVKIQPINEVGDIDCTYLVLVVNNDERMPVSIIRNVELKKKLDSAINHRFYITSEFSKDELLDEQQIIIGTGEHDVTGKTGILMNPKLAPGVYEVVLVAILKYGESFSIGFATSDTFEIK